MLNSPLTAATAIAWATPILTEAGVDTPRLDAQLLLAWALKLRREDLAREPELVLDSRARIIFRKSIELRAQRRPLPYITGTAWFYGREFKVNQAVLIPRPETEMLVEIAIDEFRRKGNPSGFRVADIGTGSGCIAVSIACEIPSATVVATDISRLALLVAKKNRRRYDCGNLEFGEGDLLDPLGVARFDLIVSNPPYIYPSDAPSLMPEVRDYEPALALFGTEAIRRRLLEQSLIRLKADGLLAFEVGIGQADSAAEDAKKLGYCNVEIISDMAGIGRVLACRKIG